METNLKTIEGAKKVMFSLSNIHDMSDYYAASGYAAVFSE